MSFDLLEYKKYKILYKMLKLNLQRGGAKPNNFEAYVETARKIYDSVRTDYGTDDTVVTGSFNLLLLIDGLARRSGINLWDELVEIPVEYFESMTHDLDIIIHGTRELQRSIWSTPYEINDAKYILQDSQRESYELKSVTFNCNDLSKPHMFPKFDLTATISPILKKNCININGFQVYSPKHLFYLYNDNERLDKEKDKDVWKIALLKKIITYGPIFVNEPPAEVYVAPVDFTYGSPSTGTLETPTRGDDDERPRYDVGKMGDVTRNLFDTYPTPPQHGTDDVGVGADVGISSVDGSGVGDVSGSGVGVSAGVSVDAGGDDSDVDNVDSDVDSDDSDVDSGDSDVDRDDSDVDRDDDGSPTKRLKTWGT